MSITLRPMALDGLVEIVPTRFADQRGFFSETYNQGALKAAGIDLDFVQDNVASSASRGTLRGLHYQLPPHAQDKLVRVSRGSIWDVAVDLRRGSTTFGQWESVLLSAEKWNQVLIPKGFAHGYLTLEDETEVNYKVTAHQAPEHERCVRFDDRQINIEWPMELAEMILSDKDSEAPGLAGADVF
ncbi:MAG: dTDP-4-dehydrorhamnose 3,5-epimerase [Alphaproteobacteria bacterium]|nr:dTDP-4-dehydrorhamnose 3,5-epimerase [Alphaproteobacteria bacterium]